jgi:iron complex transport system ATP-binding protein
MLEVKDLSVQYGDMLIVDSVSFSLEENQWLMIVGPNGAGKSTLINAISQGIDYKGTVLFDGQDVSGIRPAELAKRMGVLMQNNHVGYSFTVAEVVKLGRYAYSTGVFGGLSNEDEERIEHALEMTGMVPMREQPVMTLSGGELQRAFLAQLLAQNPRLLILDEPSNHLDLLYQKQVFELISHWVKAPGRAVISVVHDLSHAKAYGTHALLLNHGKNVASGETKTALSNEALGEAYNMDVSSWMLSMLSQWSRDN